MTEELITQTAIAVEENRSERTIANWRKRYPDFPSPVFLPCGGRVLFRRSEYEAWRKRRDQERAA